MTLSYLVDPKEQSNVPFLSCHLAYTSYICTIIPPSTQRDYIETIITIQVPNPPLFNSGLRTTKKSLEKNEGIMNKGMRIKDAAFFARKVHVRFGLPCPVQITY
jgi:hypothetical protein